LQGSEFNGIEDMYHLIPVTPQEERSCGSCPAGGTSTPSEDAETKWLLVLAFHNQCYPVWRRLAQEILMNPAKAFPERAATKLRDIAKRLSG